jgi:hypothetical protein
MRCSVEVYAQKPLFFKDDDYICLSLISKGKEIKGTAGCDRYVRGTAMLSNKRIAAIGRKYTYDFNSRSVPIGLGTLEARPGAYIELKEDELEDLELKIDTNTLLDPALVRDLWGIRFVNYTGKSYDVPLARPDIQIHWNGRGSYTIPITEFINSKLIFPIAMC